MVGQSGGAWGGRKESGEVVNCVLEVAVIITLTLYGVYLGVVMGRGEVDGCLFEAGDGGAGVLARLHISAICGRNDAVTSVSEARRPRFKHRPKALHAAMTSCDRGHSRQPTG